MSLDQLYAQTVKADNKTPQIKEKEKTLLTVTNPIDLSATVSMESAHQLFSDSANQKEQRLMVALPLELKLKEVIGRDWGEVYAQGIFIKEDSAVLNGQSMINDYHVYSNLKAEDRVQLFEVYWSKTWAQTTLRLGKLDANDHFAVSEHESALINGAAGYSPSIFGMPSYPDSAWSIQFAQEFQRIELSIAVFDGGSTTLSPTPTGAHFGFSKGVSSGDLFYIAQITAHLGQFEEMTDNEITKLLTSQQDRDLKTKSPFHVTLGIWTHRGDVVPTFGDEITVNEQDHLELGEEQIPLGEPSSGIFLTSDLKLMSLARGGELGLGVQMAVSSYYHPLHLSAALTWSEIFSPIAWSEQGLSLALGFSHLTITNHLIHLNDQRGNNENLFELTTCLPLTPSLLTSLSWVTLHGQHLEEDFSHLLVVRVLLGIL